MATLNSSGVTPAPFYFVESVQEVARKSEGQTPQNYIRGADEMPAATLPSSEDQFPIIDMSKLVEVDDEIRNRELDNLAKACQDWGFFHLINHRVPSALMQRMLGVIRDFFGLPHEEKMKYARKPGGIDGYGVRHIFDETQKRDWGDYLGYFVQPKHMFPSYLPSQPQDFSETLEEYGVQTRRVADEVLRAMAVALGLDREYFNDKVSVMYVNGNFYPVCLTPEVVAGLSAHADGSALTLLLQDDNCIGLHVFHHGKWIVVPPLKGSIVVNIGDQLEAMSNGKFQSVNHRAVPNKERDRISVGAFYLPDFDDIIAPAAKIVEETGKAHYKTFLFKEFLDFYESNRLNNKEVFDEFAKIV